MFPPFLLYVRWKSGVTFVRRCFCDGECACANLISKANFNLINRPDLFICLHLMFRISLQNSKGQKSYRKFLGVRSELLLSIYTVYIYSATMKRFQFQNFDILEKT